MVGEDFVHASRSWRQLALTGDKCCNTEAMRFRLVIILALAAGVMGLVFLAERKSPNVSPSTNASAGVASRTGASESSFRKAANTSTKAGDLTEVSPPVATSNFFQRLSSE